MANKWLDNLKDLWDRLTTTRAGYLDELDFDLTARLGTPAGASLAADLLTIDNLVDDLETAIGAIEGATTLHNKLTAARAGYLDNINNAQLLNITATRLGYIDLLGNGTVGLTALEALVDDIENMLAGAAGIVTFPAAAAPGDGVSLAEVIRQIYDDITDMGTLQETGGTLTADGTEQNVVINNAPAGIFIPLTIKIDLDLMQAGDTTVIKVYERIKSGGSLQQKDYQSYTGADGGLTNGNELIHIELKENRFGFQVTLQQSAGVNRNYDWEYFYQS